MDLVRRIFTPIRNRIVSPEYTPFVRGLYHGQWITLLTLGSLLILFAVLSWTGAAPPGLPLEDIINTPERYTSMPIPPSWTQAETMEELCKTALGDHLVSYDAADGVIRIEMLAQLSPVYPKAADAGEQVQELRVNPVHIQAARRVAAYLMKACFTRFSDSLDAIEIQILYPYRDGYGGSDMVPGGSMALTQKGAAAIDWDAVTSSALIKQTMQ